MAQQIRELMTPNPVVLPGTASVHEAARAMRDADISDVIVIENNQICGIVTDRDIVVRLVAEAWDPVSPIMRVGHPWEVIVEVATSLKAELLILGSHSQRGLLGIVLGGPEAGGGRGGAKRPLIFPIRDFLSTIAFGLPIHSYPRFFRVMVSCDDFL